MPESTPVKWKLLKQKFVTRTLPITFLFFLNCKMHRKKFSIFEMEWQIQYIKLSKITVQRWHSIKMEHQHFVLPWSSHDALILLVWDHLMISWWYLEFAAIWTWGNIEIAPWDHLMLWGWSSYSAPWTSQWQAMSPTHFYILVGSHGRQLGSVQLPSLWAYTDNP